MDAGDVAGLFAMVGSVLVAGLIAREFFVVTRAERAASWFRLAAASALVAGTVGAVGHLDPRADLAFVTAWAALLGGFAVRAALAGWKRWGMSQDKQGIEVVLWFALTNTTYGISSRTSPGWWQTVVLVLIAAAILVVARQPALSVPRTSRAAVNRSD